MAPMDKFRLRRFVEKLNEIGEVDIIDEPTDLTNITSVIQNTPKAVWFKQVGRESLELVANVNGSRNRLAIAMGVTEENLLFEYQKRINNPQPIIDVKTNEAPVQEIVLEGAEIDLAKLPFYLQHQLDGSPYISSGIDYSVDPTSGITNVGCRRLSLRNSHEAGTNLTAPSDLKRIYTESSSRNEILPVNFALGSHPIDYLAAGMKIPADELALVSSLRGEPVPMVRGVSNDVRVPADAELIIEGYLDEKGYVEPDGPYGEYVGFYGPMHQDPVYHVTAITMRKDVLHQTLLHGVGPHIHRAESVHLMSVNLENKALSLLKKVNIDVSDVFVPPGSAEGQHLRVAISKTSSDDVKITISTLIQGMFVSKHVFVVDNDIDIRDEHQWEWAFVSRFQADRDLTIFPDMRGMPMDPSLEEGLLGTKAGFDLTLPTNHHKDLKLTVATAPRIQSSIKYKTVAEALNTVGSMYFSELMEALGSYDGREIILELDGLRKLGKLMRDGNGKYLIGEAPKGTTGLFGPQQVDPNSHT